MLPRSRQLAQMNSSHAALVVASTKLPNTTHPLIIDTKLHLTFAIALTQAYDKVWHSIYWNGSTERTKRRVRQKLSDIAFDAYTSLLDAGQSLNAYVDEVGEEALPEDWREIMGNLNSAYRWINEEHGEQIRQKQLSLF